MGLSLSSCIFGIKLKASLCPAGALSSGATSPDSFPENPSYLASSFNMPQLTWLITGCSSGLGERFVHQLLGRGERVIATARNGTSRLGSLNEAGAAILDLDVTAPQGELDSKIEQAIAIYGSIDVLVNNAGYIEAGMVEEIR